MLTEIMAQTPTFQKAVYRGELVDSDDVLDFIMNRPNVMPRHVLSFKLIFRHHSSY